MSLDIAYVPPHTEQTGGTHPHELHEKQGRLRIQAGAVELHNITVEADALQQLDFLHRHSSKASSIQGMHKSRNVVGGRLAALHAMTHA